MSLTIFFAYIWQMVGKYNPIIHANIHGVKPANITGSGHNLVAENTPGV